jgi:hypothetical protein
VLSIFVYGFGAGASSASKSRRFIIGLVGFVKISVAVFGSIVAGGVSGVSKVSIHTYPIRFFGINVVPGQ